MTGEDDPVFASPLGAHLDGSALRRRFVDAARRAGLRTLPFHSLRHFFGSMAVNKASLVQVQTWMGHATAGARAAIRFCHARVRQTVRIALVVAAILTAVSQGGVIAAGDATTATRVRARSTSSRPSSCRTPGSSAVAADHARAVISGP
jgi:hypothetical protein